MKLAEIFNQLMYGELSQMGFGVLDNGDTNEKHYASLMAHINLGLTALYKRFTLKEGRIVLELQTDQAVYPLQSRFAVTGKGALPVRYIKDSVMFPFLEDIHKIERVITDRDYEMALNDSSNKYACATPSSSILRVPAIMVNGATDIPEELKTATLTVVYRANHPVIDINVGSFDPATKDIELPYTHLQALLLFVASRVNNPIGMTNEFHAGNSYAAKYEQECQLLESNGLEVDQDEQNSKAAVRGWV